MLSSHRPPHPGPVLWQGLGLQRRLNRERSRSRRPGGGRAFRQALPAPRLTLEPKIRMPMTEDPGRRGRIDPGRGARHLRAPRRDSRRGRQRRLRRRRSALPGFLRLPSELRGLPLAGKVAVAALGLVLAGLLPRSCRRPRQRDPQRTHRASPAGRQPRAAASGLIADQRPRRAQLQPATDPPAARASGGGRRHRPRASG